MDITQVGFPYWDFLRPIRETPKNALQLFAAALGAFQRQVPART